MEGGSSGDWKREVAVEDDFKVAEVSGERQSGVVDGEAVAMGVSEVELEEVLLE